MTRREQGQVELQRAIGRFRQKRGNARIARRGSRLCPDEVHIVRQRISGHDSKTLGVGADPVLPVLPGITSQIDTHDHEDDHDDTSDRQQVNTNR